MKNRKKKGFSLAELLISLLIISIVLAAAIPTITKRNAAGGEKIWHWTNTNNSAYFGVGSNQTAIIGADQIPFVEDLGVSSTYLSNYFQDDDVFGTGGISSIAEHFTTTGDKLVLLKKAPTMTSGSDKIGLSNFVNSHISFYNIDTAIDATTKDIQYAGRLASDRHNLALGIASLQSYNTTSGEGGYNTALGHHTLTYNNEGLYNTAIGEKALARNTIGNDNTAVGFMALTDLTTPSSESEELKYSGNTAVGSEALVMNIKGQGNTAVGYRSLFTTVNTTYTNPSQGSYNTAVGGDACSNVKGSYNVCLGYSAGNMSGNPNNTTNFALNIGAVRTNVDENSLAGIGATVDDSVYESKYDIPIITGVSQAYKVGGAVIDKALQVNAKKFSINTFDGRTPILSVSTYTDNNTGDAYFSYVGTGNAPNTYKPRGVVDVDLVKDALRLTFGSMKEASNTNQEAQIWSYTPNQYSSTDDSMYKNIRFNDMLKMSFSNNAARRVDLSTQHKDRNQLGWVSLNDTALQVYGNNVVGIFRDDSNNYAMYMLKEASTAKKTFGLNTDIMQVNVGDATSSEKFVWNEYGPELNSSKRVLLKAGNARIGMTASANSVDLAGNQIFLVSDDVTVGKSSNYEVRIQNGDIVLKDGGSAFGLKAKLKELGDRITAYHSDARLKNISGDSVAGLKEINALEVKNYTYKKDEKKTPHVGVIAQQLQKVFPNSVFEDEDGYLKIRTEEIFFAMVNSIKELFAMVQDLTAKVTGLDKRLTELEQQNKLLKQQNEAFEKRLEKLEKQMAK